MMEIAIAFGAGAFGGVLGFWGMFALAEWLFTREEPKRPPRKLPRDGYRLRGPYDPYGVR